LRDSAEAVGRGDFSRRVEVRSADECGELARVFNQMTENLKSSREQLESTVVTLKTTQAQLIQSEKLSGIGEFIAGVAHELNNPLTTIMGFAELLRQAVMDTRHKRSLEMVHKSALRCQKIVQALLSFARRRAPESKPACLNGLIEAALEILHYQLRTSNIEVITRLDPQLPPVMADPHQIQQVVVNIINNARQAIESHQPKGWIRIVTEARAEKVCVTIQDSGPGIPEENVSRIFDPFFTTKEVGKGTGLGLAIVYGIVKQHGGYIHAVSDPGKGTTFMVYLPLVVAPLETARPIEPEVLKGGQATILVAEDDTSVRNLTRAVLEGVGYTVIDAVDGEEALVKFEQHAEKIQLLLLDVLMPKKNGVEVYEMIRRSHPEMKALFTSGYTADQMHEKGILDKALHFIAKPVSPRGLLDKVRELLDAEPDAVPPPVAEPQKLH
jgi:two-component system NtrC family sensor kinase